MTVPLKDINHAFKHRLFSALSTHRFALAAFLIPLGIRAIPEVLVGPYQAGWDTMVFCVPNRLDWAAG